MTLTVRVATYLLFSAVCLLSTVDTGYTQDRQIPEAEFGQIPDSLFLADSFDRFNQSPYVYAFKELNISFETDGRSVIAILDYHIRIKVFDADQREASVVGIPYHFANEVEQVQNIRGYTYTPDGRRQALSGEAIRTININARYNVKEFTMPEVVDGSVIEYSYRKKRRYIEELPDYYLAHRVPTMLAKVRIQYPDYLRYDVTPSGYNNSLDHYSVRRDTSSVPKVFSLPQPDPILNEYWIAEWIPPVEKEAYISSINDYRGKLKFQLSEFGLPRQKLENSWDFVVAKIRREQNPMDVVAGSDSAQKLGRQISKMTDSREAAQDSIFRYLNNRMNFNGSKSSYSEQPASEVLSGNLAGQASINQTLLAMLRGAGIDAYPMMISTRQFGRINRSFPSYFQFNGLLAYSQIGEKTYFMDASFAESYPNLIPVDTYNETGLLLRESSYEWSEIAPEKSYFSIEIDLTAELDREGNLSGSLEAVNHGYTGRLIREKGVAEASEEQIIREVLFDGYSEVSLSGAEIVNEQSYEKPVRIKTEFSIDQYATSFSDALEYRPMIVGYLMSNPFNEDRRDLPVTLDAPEFLDLDYTLKLPPGHSLKKGVSNRVTKLQGGSLEEGYVIGQREVRYRFRIDLSRKRFEPELYPQLLNLYERWVQLSNMKWQIKRN